MSTQQITPGPGPAFPPDLAPGPPQLSTRAQSILAWLDEHVTQEHLRADGFEDAIIGHGFTPGKGMLLIYSFDQCVQILAKRNGMTVEDAIEYLEFNAVGAYCGETTPVFMYGLPAELVDEPEAQRIV